MKKIIAFLVVFLFVLSSQTAFASFMDVSQSHENYDAILYVQSAGIVQGYSDGTYRPDQTINRAEFTKIIIEARFDEATIDSCLSDHGTELIFTDVSHSEWYAKYVCTAFHEGIVSGYPDGTYGPTKEISSVEAAKIIVKAFGYETASDTPWYKPYIVALGERAALPLTITAFDQNITRGEMAEMIYRLQEGITTKDATTYSKLAGEATAAEEFTLVATEFSFAPSTITVHSGEDVKITVVNNGQCSHNFTLDGVDSVTTTLGAGESKTLEFTAPAIGTYTFYCSIPGHREAGMQGTLIVQ